MRARVYDVKEFVEWFRKQIMNEMKCRDVDIESITVHVGGASIVFKCGNKKFLAEIRRGRKFSFSMYAFIYDIDGRLIGIEKHRLGGPLKVYDKRFGPSNSVLFYVEDDVVVDVYETQPGGLIEPNY
jgi:hypothetical protein